MNSQMELGAGVYASPGEHFLRQRFGNTAFENRFGAQIVRHTEQFLLQITPYINSDVRASTQFMHTLLGACNKGFGSLNEQNVDQNRLRVNLPAEVLAMPKDAAGEEISYTIKFMENANWRYPAQVMVPNDESLRPSFCQNPTQGDRLFDGYVEASRDLVYGTGENPLLTTNIVVLPNGSQFSPWVSTFGPLLAVGNNAANLFREENGIGFHPEHETHHRWTQMLYPKTYFKWFGRVPLFDEACAISQENQAFISLLMANHYYYIPQQDASLFRQEVPTLPERDHTPKGNQSMYMHELRYLLKAVNIPDNREGDAVVQYQYTPDTAFVVPKGNEGRRALQFDNLGNLLSIADMVSPVFDSRKYPMFSLFSRFLDRIQNNLKRGISRANWLNSVGDIDETMLSSIFWMEPGNKFKYGLYPESQYTYSHDLIADLQRADTMNLIAPAEDVIQNIDTILRVFVTGIIARDPRVGEIMLGEDENPLRLYSTQYLNEVFAQTFASLQDIPSMYALFEQLWKEKALEYISPILQNLIIIEIPGRE